ncbi:MAG: hypothetical protein CSA79_00595 [Thiothrix nivea]|nr:MAG: hypothetical protein CSA79_00595 [Thiothrix nivea]
MLGNLFSTGTIVSSAHVPLPFWAVAARQLRLAPLADNSSGEGTENELLQLWRFLSHHIRRYPYDLRAHVQRILLTSQEGLLNRSGGSLLDLFLALGSSGRMLRERMLEECRERLDKATYERFSRWLNEGVSERESGWLCGSMLTTGEVAPVRKLLQQQRSSAEEATGYADVLAEVQDHLEYGQVDLAQALLETEILEGRSTPELEQELLTVYQYTRNRNRLEEVAGALTSAGYELSGIWHEARMSAETW